jgi:mannose-6-phosphate isomerase-like protein (cupin superfamily)
VEHHRPADVAADHPDFRRVLWTGEHTQLVVMTIQPGDAIGAETHDHNDQILAFTSGTGEAVIAGETRPIGPVTSSRSPPGSTTTSATRATNRSC